MRSKAEGERYASGTGRRKLIRERKGGEGKGRAGRRKGKRGE